MERGELARRLGGNWPGTSAHPHVIDEGEPVRFMASFAQAVSGGGNIFLADPSWRSTERGVLARFLGEGLPSDRGWIMIASGGSSGGLKFARHDSLTVSAAVRGFCAHFGLERVNSVSVLPLHHVSGFMAWMRSALTGGRFIPWPWKELEAGRFPQDLPGEFCISLVPTQLQRLLASGDAVDWLRRFRIVFLGGGPPWEELLEEAARLGIPLAPSYGATETAAMAAALRPEQFLGGIRGCGAPLPHVRIEILDGGIVRIAGDSLFRGYFPEMSDQRTWTTDDLGEFDANGSLFILGRSDGLIMTGGKKVSPSEVEAVLRASGEFDDVAVIGLPDPDWGQIVVACHPPGREVPRGKLLVEALSGLAPYKHPKRYVSVEPWPRNAQGKINRAELARLASGS